jgi:predicted lipid-binding transport protein (Tim44 family)
MADFLQVTVRISASQRLRVLDKEGNMIAGKEEFVGPVEDYWVIEKALTPNAEWKLCATDVKAFAAPSENLA